MNFLAHLYLSGQEEELMVGNFIADMISNRQLAEYSLGIQKGVHLHRKIDQFTDKHPSVLKGVRRLYTRHRKYAPAIIDVFYDYLLANNWENYSDQSLEDYTSWAYTVLMNHHSIMPPGLKRSLPQMVADDWLTKYAELYGMRRAFRSMKKRVSKPEWLDGVVDTLQDQLPELSQEFKEFFPDIILFSKDEGRRTKNG